MSTSCVVCGHESHVCVTNIKCCNLEPSSLYEHIKIMCCENCGHIFNLLNQDEREGIIKFYQEEYSFSSLASPGNGDMPGSDGPFSLSRYESLYDAVHEFLIPDSHILDVGCAAGGYLAFLKHKGYKHLYGIDLCAPYVVEANKKKDIIIAQGTAEHVPFDKDFDLITSSQVVEHLFDPNQFFLEVKRLLKPHGHLCVNVPDAVEYSTHSFFDLFWFLIREHVHHFDEIHLRSLALKHGFTCIKTMRIASPMLSECAFLPNLIMVFRNGDSKSLDTSINHDLKRKLTRYAGDRDRGRMCALHELSKSKVPIYVWGMSREFTYLYENSNLKDCNILGLLDDTPIKQTKSVNGMKIQSSDILKNSDVSRHVLITSFAHLDKMAQKVNEMGHKWITI